jgi:DNA-directed RNA polymerase specialized sigma24 family protein
MSNPEIAQHLNVSLRTIEGDWTFARAWLKRELAGRQTTSSDE